MIYNEDCLAGMSKIPDGSVDLILTDLPYGITACDWDKRLPIPDLFEQFWRVAKLNAAIVLFAQMPFGSDLIQCQRKFFRYEWIWEKHLAVGMFNCNRMPMRCHENILVFYRKLPTYNPQFSKGEPYFRKSVEEHRGVYTLTQRLDSGSEDGKRYPRDVIKFVRPRNWGKNKKEMHPTQKPVDLLEYLIKTYSNEGETVLDATMGSGSTGVACANTGRNFIGFETKTDFYNIAEKRINEALENRGLFLLGGTADTRIIPRP